MTQHTPDYIEDMLKIIDEQNETIGRLRQDKAEMLEALQALMGTCCHRIEWERKWPNIVEKCKAAIAKATQ